MSNVKMLLSKDGRRLKKKLGITDDEYADMLKDAMKEDTRNKWMNNHKLIINKKLPKVYMKKGLEKEIAEYHNKNLNGKSVADMIMKQEPIKEGYLTLSFKDFLDIDYPEETEVIRMIQEYSKPELLEQLKEMQGRIEDMYDKVKVWFKVEKGVVTSHSIFGGSKEIKITDATVDEKLFNKLEEVELSEINTSFKFHIDTHENDESFGYLIREDIANDDTVPSMSVLIQVIVEMLNNNAESYIITKENLNEKIKKDTNEGIQLHREMKQHLKKSNVPIYYIDKIIGGNNR